jgi:hypothetical protein
VCPSGCAFSDLSTAIKSASNAGDIIHLERGSYNLTQVTYVGTPLTIRFGDTSYSLCFGLL